MAAELRQTSICGAAAIKQESVETDPLASPKREIEDVFVKEEAPFLYEWELPGNVSSARDPLSIKEEECSPQEDYIGPSTFNIEKTEDEQDEEETVSNNVGEVETDPLASTKQEIEDEFLKEESLEIKYGMELASCSSQPESTVPVGVEDNNGADDCVGLDPNVHLVHRSSVGLKRSAQLQNVKDHIHVGSCEFLHSCSVCLKTFTRSSYLNSHVRRLHNSERPYCCGVCNKTFTHSSTLKPHSLLHTGERPYSCGVCNKTFTQSSHFKSHSLLHSGERPYSCGVCYKKFTQSSALKSHSLLHSGERPYSCGVCNKTFTRSSHLKPHSFLHTGERPYSCGVCNKTFTHSSALKTHSFLHTDDRPYSCGVCNKTFKRNSHLKQHSKLHTAVVCVTSQSEAAVTRSNTYLCTDLG